MIINKQKTTEEGGELAEVEQKLKSGAAADGKKLMADNAQRINKVWQAFTKFVKN